MTDVAVKSGINSNRMIGACDGCLLKDEVYRIGSRFLVVERESSNVALKVSEANERMLTTLGQHMQHFAAGIENLNEAVSSLKSEVNDILDGLQSAVAKTRSRRSFRSRERRTR